MIRKANTDISIVHNATCTFDLHKIIFRIQSYLKNNQFFSLFHRHSLANSGCFNRIEKSVHMPTSQLVCLLTRHLLSFVQYFLILDNFNHKKKSMKIQPILQESIQENNYISRNSRQNSDPGISLQGYFGQIYGLKRL